jgi:hypothetical protein
MKFKLWCDRLDFKRHKDPTWKSAPGVVPGALRARGLRHAAGSGARAVQREHHLRPPFCRRHIVVGVELIAAKCNDEATGEKLATKSYDEITV